MLSIVLIIGQYPNSDCEDRTLTLNQNLDLNPNPNPNRSV